MRIVVSNAFSLNMLNSGVDLRFRKIDLEKAREIVKRHEIISVVGHESTARFLTEVLGVPIVMNRTEYKFNENEDVILVAQIKTRLPEGKILDKEELKKVAVEFWLVAELRPQDYASVYWSPIDDL